MFNILAGMELKLASDHTLELYLVDKDYLQREAYYAPLLNNQSVSWIDGNDDEPDYGCGYDSDTFNGRDYEFQKLGSIRRICINDNDVSARFQRLTDMSVFTKEEILTILEKIKAASDRDDFLISFHNDRLSDYLKAVGVDENKVIVGLIDDGFNIYKHQDNFGYE